VCRLRRCELTRGVGADMNYIEPRLTRNARSGAFLLPPLAAARRGIAAQHLQCAVCDATAGQGGCTFEDGKLVLQLNF
jgi:hypothetical protein